MRVETEQAYTHARRLVITAGPWAERRTRPTWICRCRCSGSSTSISRQRAPELFAPDACPVYLMQVPEGDYYGFPRYPARV